MDRADDPFIALTTEMLADDFAALEQRPMAPTPEAPAVPVFAVPAIGRLNGFDLQNQPLVGNLSACPGQVVTGRTVVALCRAMIGRDVVVLFEGGEANLPVIMGVIQSRALQEVVPALEPGVRVQVDGERHVIEAELEIVLRCGDASITLTRAGKVIIKGNYILSRSTGYNKIKGAAIDIN